MLSLFAHADHSPKVLASIHPLGLIASSVVDAEQLDVLLQPGVPRMISL